MISFRFQRDYAKLPPKADLVGKFRTLRPYFVDHRWRLLFGLLALVTVDFLQLLIPRVIRRVVDGLTYGTATPHLLIWAALAVMVLTLGIGAMRFAWRYLILGHARRIEEALRNLIFGRIQTLSAAQLGELRTGDLMAHATNDIEAVRMAVGMGIVALVDGIVLGAAAIGFMLYINLTLTLIAIIPMPAVAIITRFQSREVHRRFRDVQAGFSTLTERVRESFAGIRVVKAYLLEAAEGASVREAAADYVARNMSLARIMAAFVPLVTLFANLVAATVLFLGGRKVIGGTITTGDFVAFMAYLAMLTWPMMAIGWVINLIQRGAASMDRINSILERQPGVVDAQAAAPVPADRPAQSGGDIEVRDLSFSYEGSPAALTEVSLSMPAGRQVAIVGRTGSGKSTLANLLLRIYDPLPRTIFYRGVDIRDLPLAFLRGQVAYVPQDTFLFSDTIRENIAFARPDAPLDEVERTARLAEVHADIMALPRGYESTLGEKGITLSGGQRQRLALARALLAGSPVLLLDDALSAVDTDTERKILQNLGREVTERGRTLIMISHRLAAVMDSWRIYVLEEGRLAEEGSHEELLQRRGLYADIWRRQQLEAEIEADLPRGAEAEAGR
jgi:ATP-binding cassette subfamily B multidrug efflux pump